MNEQHQKNHQENEKQILRGEDQRNSSCFTQKSNTQV